MVESRDLAIGAAGLGAVYYLSRTREGGGGGGQNKRPGRIPLPIGGGGGGGGISPGLAGLLAQRSGQGPGAGLGQLGGIFSGLLENQSGQLQDALSSQQAGFSRLFKRQQQLFSGLVNQQKGGNLPDNVLTQDDVSGILSNLDLGNSGGGGGGGSGSTGPALTGTQQYNLLAADKGNIPPEARGANPILEAARGVGEATGAALRTPSKGIDYTADLIGGDAPGAFSTTGGITGAAYEAGQTTGEAIDTLPPAVVGGPVEMIANKEGPFNWG